MEQLSLNLTLDEINAILEALGQRPYQEVFQLVEKIQTQSEAQLQPQQSIGTKNQTEK